MTSLRFFVLVLFSLQLSPCVFSTTNVTEDAQLALKSLRDQIESSSKAVSETIPDVWNSYISSINETVTRGLSYNIGNYTAVLQNLTKLSNILSDGKECLSDGLDLYLDNDNNDFNMVTNEQLVYENFRDLANLEVDYVLNHYKDLEKEFNESCVVNRNNCNGTSQFVISEVERLILITERIPYDFLFETHLLGYRLEADWATTQANVNIEYQKTIQNVTTCLALKFENYRTELLGVTQQEIPKNVDESIFDEYAKVFGLVQDTFIDSHDSLFSYSLMINEVGNEVCDSTTKEIHNAITTKANKTVQALIDFAQDHNIDIDDCSKPNLSIIRSEALIRAVSEYTEYFDSGTFRYIEGLDYLSTTINEIKSIYLQVKNCTGTVDCGSISEKLTEKITEIPSLVQGRGNATVVLQHQIVTGIRESGYKVVRDALDQLEASIVYLKDCIRNQLY